MLKNTQKSSLIMNKSFALQTEHSEKKETFTVTDEEALSQPFQYLVRHFPQDVSESLNQAFNQMSVKPKKDVEEVLHFVNTLKNATVLIDDIDEEIALQNDIPGAHHIFGLPMAINTAHYIKIKAVASILKIIPKDKVIQSVRDVANELIKYHEKEGLVIYLMSLKNQENQREIEKLKAEKQQAFVELGVRLVKLLNEEKAKTSN